MKFDLLKDLYVKNNLGDDKWNIAQAFMNKPMF